MKKIFALLLISFFYTTVVNGNTNDDNLYKKIDLFVEVLEKIKKEYVDEVDQSELIDDAINGALSGNNFFYGLGTFLNLLNRRF